MSGISGILNLNRQPMDSEHLNLMVSSMRHRGPDGQNSWCDELVGLGHCLLKTTPESLYEKQPYEQNDLVIIADARIDNRQELIDALDLPHTAPGIPDSELILHAYEKWGRECPELLIGDFAFAIWDKAEQSLFLARDPFGIKQLFYFLKPDQQFAFATEIKSLLTLPDVSGNLNEPVIAEFISGWPHPKETIYTDIVRLLPGYAMYVTSHSIKEREYYHLKPADVPAHLTDEEYATRFLEIFEKAVRARTRSAFPVGAELSGGLDSSFVTMIAYRILQQSGELPLHSFSTVYEQFKKSDERVYIRKILENRDIASHFTVADRADLFSLLDDIFNYLDDGRVAGNHYLNWLTLREASQTDVRVMLTGQDGDSVVSHGWKYFSELAKRGDWATFHNEANLTINNLRKKSNDIKSQEKWQTSEDILSAYAGSQLVQWAKEGRFIKLFRGLRDMRKYFSIDVLYVVKKLFKKMIIPSFVWNLKADTQQSESKIPDVLNEEFVAQAGLENRLQQMRVSHIGDIGLREEQLQILQSPYIYSNFEKIDMYAAAFGIEARHPFMDRRLIEFCLALPSSQSYSDGWSRMIMRRAMEGIVPDSIRWRPDKADLSEPLQYLFFNNNDRTIERLLYNTSEFADMFNYEKLKSLYSNKQKLSESDFASLMKAINILYWNKKMSEKEFSSAA